MSVLRRLACAAAAVAFLFAASPRSDAAEAVVGDPVDAGVQVIDPQALAVHQYFYVDFPQRLAALQAERSLAEAEIRSLERRVDSYRPMRSFHQYGATYTADMRWQWELAAARLNLVCLQNAESALWRERQLTAMRLAAAGADRP
jgi:hypothetical protein